MPKRRTNTDSNLITMAPRNPLTQHPLMRKGGIHQKSNSAKRAADRRETRRQSRDWSVINPVYLFQLI